MADELSDSNHSSLNDITYPNPTISESSFTSSWGSYSSFFTASSFKSNIDSNDQTDNEDCDDTSIAELTRQMADYMLQEDDTNNNDNDIPFEAFSSRKTISQNQDQYQVGRNSKHGKRGKMNESTQKIKSSRDGRVRHIDHGPLTTGWGMRAIFLKGPGSKNEPNGTGVFLPCSETDSKTHSRKKPGCSTALVPTRVLQALEHHFKQMGSLSPSSNLLLGSLSPSSNLLQVQRPCQGERSSRDMQRKKVRLRSTSTDHVEKKLPQEWTY